MLKRKLFAFLGLVFLLIMTVGGLLAWFVVIDPGQAVSPRSIERILAVESPVFYSDGQSKLGVFFDQTHRQYVPYDRIPRDFVNAIVAAEDQDFFRHGGVDPMGIARALFANVRAGRVVQGGSTITQQTAKNLFKRKDRSLFAKLKELIYALRLERHYSKEKILEFYANQFFVSGNGRGLGIAAEYFFDKPAVELDLVESAFIAGSVKRPNYYNPFIQKNEAEAAEARARSKARAGYVLGQMYRLGMIDEARYQEGLGREIPFRKGKTSYSLNTVMDLVKSALAEPEIQDALIEHGIDNVASSGIQVVTTVEKGLQEAALSGLRRELSRLDTRLRGYDGPALQETYRGMTQQEFRGAAPGSFVVASIVSIDRKTPAVIVSFSPDDPEAAAAGQGVIDRPGLMNLLDPLVKYHRQRWSEARAEDLPLLLDQLREGDLVVASVREVDPRSGNCRLNLEKYPEVQGAVLAMKEGLIRAMAGGFDNRFFNRALHAKRTMGSTIKPLVYSAAIQLGWNSLDPLDNRRNMFLYQKQAYFPRPDHESPHDEVSMSWAGAHSENLATVWLLYHLCDKLTPLQFKEVAEHLGLTQRDGESTPQYVARIRDEHGINVDREARLQAAFRKAVDLVQPDLLFAGDLSEFRAVGDLYYGAGFSGLAEQIDSDFAVETGAGSRKKAEEARLRQKFLRKNYLRYMELLQELLVVAGADEAAAGPGRRGRLYHDPSREIYMYGEEAEGPFWIPLPDSEAQSLFAGMAADERRRFVDEVRIDGLVRAVTLEQLREALDREFEILAAKPSYDFEVLSQIHDFRILVALRYLVSFSRALGIESDLDPVLSFPLGSNVISLMELAGAYEVLVSGTRFQSGPQGGISPLAIIDRVLDVDGELIYAPERQVSTVIDPKVTLAVYDILRNVVRHGTGRSADRAVRLHSRDAAVEARLQALDPLVPVAGKTGTANSSRNAVFVGAVPAVHQGALRSAGAYVLACYVGFDDNKPMERSSTHVSGATGALPLWTEMANAILLEGDYAAQLDLTDFTFSGDPELPVIFPDLGQVDLPLETAHGGLPAGFSDRQRDAFPVGSLTATTFVVRKGDGDTEPARFFYPFWKTGEN